MSLISRFIFIATGSFAIWMTKGFKGTFDNEMVGIGEEHSARGTKRYFLGIGIWIVILVIMSAVLTRPADTTDTKAYKARVNEKGEMEFEEIK